MGAASHPYQFTVSGKNRPVLTFTFSGLPLPESSRDPLGSQGFVQFTIQPKAGLAPKALGENYADIFFDYNEPVRTNTTANRLYDVPARVVPAVQLAYADLVASPGISRFAPAQGRAGTLVTITGQRFDAAAAHNQVLFSGVAAVVRRASATELTVEVPAGAPTGLITLRTLGGQVARAQPSRVWYPPTLSAFGPGKAKAGTVLTINGTNFAETAARNVVLLGTVPALVVAATAT